MRGRAMITDAAAHAACAGVIHCGRSPCTEPGFSEEGGVVLRKRRNTARSSDTAKSTARPTCLVGVLHDISREKIC